MTIYRKTLPHFDKLSPTTAKAYPRIIIIRTIPRFVIPTPIFNRRKTGSSRDCNKSNIIHLFKFKSKIKDKNTLPKHLTKTLGSNKSRTGSPENQFLSNRHRSPKTRRIQWLISRTFPINKFNSSKSCCPAIEVSRRRKRTSQIKINSRDMKMRLHLDNWPLKRRRLGSLLWITKARHLLLHKYRRRIRT